MLLSATGIVRAQGAPVDAVAHSMKEGDASEIARYFGNTVDITINNSQSTYSRAQGELVVRDFFSKNTVKDFTVEHTGNSSANNSVFTIGALITSSGKYKVYILLRQREGGYNITEIRLQR